MQETRAALMRPAAMAAKTDVGGVKPQGPRHVLDAWAERHVDSEGHDGCGELGARHIADARDFHRHQARHFLQPDRGLEGTAGLVLLLRQEDGAADRRVARERHFAAGEENAHPRRIGRVLRRA